MIKLTIAPNACGLGSAMSKLAHQRCCSIRHRYLPAGRVHISGLHSVTTQFLGEERVLWRVLGDVQLVFLVFGEAWLPVALNAISVMLLAAFCGHILLLAWPQAVVLTIVAPTWRQDVLLDITRRAWPYIPWYDFLTT